MTTHTSLCTYRVKAGQEAAFEALLAKHWPTLQRLGLATDTPSLVYKGHEVMDREHKVQGPLFYTEIFTWTSPEGPMKAHEVPEVMGIWGPMAELCEDRGPGRPAMDFPGVEALSLFG